MISHVPANAIQPPVAKNMGNMASADLNRAESSVCLENQQDCVISEMKTGLRVARIAQMSIEIAIVDT